MGDSNLKEVDNATGHKDTDDFLKFIKNEKLRKRLAKTCWIIGETTGGEYDPVNYHNGGCCLIAFFRIPAALLILLLLLLAQIPVVRRCLNAFARWIKPAIDKIPDRFFMGLIARSVRRLSANKWNNGGFTGVGVLRQTLFIIVSMPATALATFLVALFIIWLLSLSGLFYLIVPFAIIDLGFIFLGWSCLGILLTIYSTYYVRFADFDFDKHDSDDGLQMACAIIGLFFAVFVTIVGVIALIAFCKPLYEILVQFRNVVQ